MRTLATSTVRGARDDAAGSRRLTRGRRAMLISWYKHSSDPGGGRGLTAYMDQPVVTKTMPGGRHQRVRRDPAPEVLVGDGDVFLMAVRSLRFEHVYRGAVLSFTREDVDVAAFNAGDAAARLAVDRALALTLEVAFSGIPVAARPPVYVTTHTHTGRLEVNLGLPRGVLGPDGRMRSWNPHPPREVSRAAWDAWRDVLNDGHGWADPLDPARQRQLKLPDWILKQRAEAERNRLPMPVDPRETIHAAILAQVERGEIRNRTEVIAALSAGGGVVSGAAPAADEDVGLDETMDAELDPGWDTDPDPDDRAPADVDATPLADTDVDGETDIDAVAQEDTDAVPAWTLAASTAAGEGLGMRPGWTVLSQEPGSITVGRPGAAPRDRLRLDGLLYQATFTDPGALARNIAIARVARSAVMATAMARLHESHARRAAFNRSRLGLDRWPEVAFDPAAILEEPRPRLIMARHPDVAPPRPARLARRAGLTAPAAPPRLPRLPQAARAGHAHEARADEARADAWDPSMAGGLDVARDPATLSLTTLPGDAADVLEPTHDADGALADRRGGADGGGGGDPGRRVARGDRGAAGRGDGDAGGDRLLRAARHRLARLLGPPDGRRDAGGGPNSGGFDGGPGGDPHDADGVQSLGGSPYRDASDDARGAHDADLTETIADTDAVPAPFPAPVPEVSRSSGATVSTGVGAVLSRLAERLQAWTRRLAGGAAPVAVGAAVAARVTPAWREALARAHHSLELLHDHLAASLARSSVPDGSVAAVRFAAHDHAAIRSAADRDTGDGAAGRAVAARAAHQPAVARADGVGEPRGGGEPAPSGDDGRPLGHSSGAGGERDGADGGVDRDGGGRAGSSDRGGEPRRAAGGDGRGPGAPGGRDGGDARRDARGGAAGGAQTSGAGGAGGDADASARPGDRLARRADDASQADDERGAGQGAGQGADAGSVAGRDEGRLSGLGAVADVSGARVTAAARSVPGEAEPGDVLSLAPPLPRPPSMPCGSRADILTRLRIAVQVAQPGVELRLRVVEDPTTEPGGMPRMDGETGAVVWIEVEGLPRLEWTPVSLRSLNTGPQPAGGALTFVIRAMAQVTGLTVIADRPVEAGATLAVSPEIYADFHRQLAENERRAAEEVRAAEEDDPFSRPGS